MILSLPVSAFSLPSLPLCDFWFRVCCDHMKRTINALIVFVALLAIWEALVRAKIWSPVLLPSPFEVAKYLANSIRDGTLLSGSLVTLKRLVLGYAAGLALGLPLGL